MEKFLSRYGNIYCTASEDFVLCKLYIFHAGLG